MTIAEFFADPKFPLTVYHDFRNISIDLHTHEFGELVFVRGGTGVHRTQTGAYSLESFDVFYVPEGMPHGYEAPRDLDLYNILFLPDRLPLDRNDLEQLPGYRLLFMLEPKFRRQHAFKSHLHLQPADADAILPVVYRLAEETRQRTAGYETMTTGLFLELVALLARAYGRRPNDAAGHLMAIDRALRYIGAHYGEDVDMSDLAGVCKMSLRSFQRAFREAVGRPPKQYLLEVRLNHAKELLRRPDARVTEAAFQSGFHDSNYFSRVFHAYEGKSPSDWLEAMRSKPGGLPCSRRGPAAIRSRQSV